MSDIEDIKNKLDIVDVISSYIKLQKAGVNYKAACPLHGEKTPSFFVSPARQIWHCFGCNRGGDIFKFVMEMENVEFKDALRQLAQRAGVTLRHENKEQFDAKKRLSDVILSATEFFEKSLREARGGKEAAEYLKKRGLEERTIGEFRVGWAPDAWTGLVYHLRKDGFNDRDMISAGLAVEGKKTDMRVGSKCYDRFRSRIMFPIFDHGGRPVGFSGRIFTPPGADAAKNAEMAKYVNSPQSEIFDKSRILYGLDRAKTEIRKAGFALLVEGQMDLIMAHQAGTGNAVATSGTALTVEHLKMLRHYAEALHTCFDMDAAGDSATKRSIDLAMAAGFDVRVVLLPQGKDPADVIAQNAEQWRTLLSQTKRIMEFYFESAFSRHDRSNLDGKKKIAQELLFRIKRLQNEVERSHWLQELAVKLQINEHFLFEELRRVRADVESIAPPMVSDRVFESHKIDRERAIFERLVGVLFSYPGEFLQVRDLLGKMEEEIFEDDIILRDTLAHLKRTEEPTLEDFRTNAPPHTHQFMEKALFKFECLQQNFEKKEHIINELKFALKELRLSFLRRESEKIKFLIQEAEQGGDTATLEEYYAKFNKIASDLSQTLKMV